MSDPLLSELCTICHTTPPKYRCPRCSIRTCSLPCTRRHKTWSQCSGRRDPAAYATRAQLETAGALDRDFNFITGVERGLERAERDARARGFGLEHGYMQETSHNKKRKRGGGGGGGGGDTRGNGNWQKPVKGESAFLRAAKEAGVKVVRSPRGMSRNKQNKSRVHPKHKCLSWTVDWIHTCGRRDGSAVQNYLETVTIGQAYDRAYPPTATATTTTTDADADADEPAASKAEPQFPPYRNVYFYIRRDDASHNIVLAPLHPSSTLKDALRGRTVHEFPRLYVRRESPEDIEKGDVEDGQAVLEETWLRDRPAGIESDENGEEDFTSSEGSSASASASASASESESEEDEREDESDADADAEASLSDIKEPA